jgi:uncharacterized protein with PIN domain
MPVGQVEVRFYGELNDFLPAQHRHRSFVRRLALPTTVKDLVEGLGVPHTEVDLILVGDRPVPFDHLVGDGERVAVYPVFEAFDLAATTRLRPAPLREPRFLADTHLGRLASDTDDAALARRSVDEHRILLTRDRGLLKRRLVTHGVFIRDDDPQAQLHDLLRRLDLAGAVRPYTRCLRCNGQLEPVAKDQIEGELPPGTRRKYHEFRRCTACRQVFWAGAHHARLRQIIDDALRAARA